ncbi:MAG: HAD-IB family hydrolase [Cyclobacteriaceae bacterium]|nr:HAD-IB family hydrolase [Cyclobacteriaceae bacterium HetDA_MAG_MS6]
MTYKSQGDKAIAFFDFDGTITIKDSLFDFLVYSFGTYKVVLSLIVLSPMLGLYLLKLVSNEYAKKKLLSYHLKGRKVSSVSRLGEKYSKDRIDTIVKKSALNRLNEHKIEGHKVVVVSASLELWLKPWCDELNLELIGTKLEIRNERITGQFDGPNCYGAEKKRRILEKYDLDNYPDIYAYGDSKGDREMSSLANHSFYKYFT